MWPPERIEMLSVTQELEQSVKCKVASIIVHHGVPAYHCPVQYYAYIENTFMHIEDNTFMVPAPHRPQYIFFIPGWKSGILSSPVPKPLAPKPKGYGLTLKSYGLPTPPPIFLIGPL